MLSLLRRRAVAGASARRLLLLGCRRAVAAALTCSRCSVVELFIWHRHVVVEASVRCRCSVSMVLCHDFKMYLNNIENKD